MAAETPGIPAGLARWGGIAWRFVGIAVAVAIVLYVLEHLRVVVVPFAFALFFAALLHPIAGRLKASRLRPALASALVMLLVLSVIGGILAAAGLGIADQSERLADAIAAGWDDLTEWVADTFGVDLSDIRSAAEGAGSAAGGLGNAVLGGATTAIEIVVGSLLALVILFFLLKDGPAMVAWALKHLEGERRVTAEELANVVWAQVSAFARGQTLIAAFDAVATAIALLVIGVPLVVPLTLLTFLGGFIPLVGPIVAAVVAGLVALADGGPGAALWVILAEVAIQQAEGNLLEPLVLGRVLRLHPLVILLAVVTGGVIGGIAGAFVAAPIAAASIAAASYLRRHDVAVAAVDRGAPAAASDR